MKGDIDMGWWRDLFTKRTEDWVYATLASNQVPEEPKSNDKVAANQAYLIITLRSMRIVNVRKLTKKFYAVVHSFISLDHLSGQDAIFQTVTSPAGLGKIDPKNLDRIIQVNKELLSAVPYRGGKVGLELGLFSVEEADLAAPFIDVLETMAQHAGVGIISAAIPFIEPLKKGIDAVTDSAGGSILEIGVSTNFTPAITGWYVVMRAPKEEVSAANLLVTPSDYRLVDAQSKKPIEDYPYLVFTVSQTDQRPDWFKLPDLTKPYEELQAAVRKGDYTAAKELVTTFKRMALTSADLIRKDAVRIADLVKAETEEALGATLTSATESTAKRELPPLESYPLYS